MDRLLDCGGTERSQVGLGGTWQPGKVPGILFGHGEKANRFRLF
jgi:hypothetical protein